MDPDDANYSRRKQRWYRKRKRYDNVPLEIDSDHSDTGESDAVSDTGERTGRPQKKIYNDEDSDSTLEDNSDERHSDQGADNSHESSVESVQESDVEAYTGNNRDNANYFEENVNLNANDHNVANEQEDYYQVNHVDSPRESNNSNAASTNTNATSFEESDGSESDREDSENSTSGSEYDNEEEDDNEALNNRPIYNGAQISFIESLISILTFIITHKLTGLCVNDLLSLIILHCGADNICLKTLHRFKTYFKMIGKHFIICHYYCTVCEVSLDTKDSVCDTCLNQNNSAYFIEFPILSQLQSMFKRPGFYDSLMFRFNRDVKNVGNIEDIYDGLIYKQLTDSGFLSNRNNISFFMYFDGIALFKSSTFSIWPVYLTINELKYKLRTRKENTVIAGIWFGKSKPNPNLFLNPLQEKLLVLENGVDLELPNGENIRVKGKLLGAVGDLPAKSLFMRFKQFNGAYSCFHCMDKGGRFDLGNASVQVYPYNRNFELRTTEETIEFGQLALDARQADPDSSVYGVKGPTILSLMLPNFILCMAIDIMHGVFLGAMKTLSHLWFDTQFSDRPFSISAFVNLVDTRLKGIKPPYSFQRFPRSFAKEFAQFKASDWKIFMFFYSLPVLNGILPRQYWVHHCKLVTAIAVLCQESISIAEIDSVDELLHSYVSEFQELYSVRYLSLTFHQLLHLPLVVRNLGPAWVYSCFYYESLNGELARLVHGSRHAALQICSSSSVFMNLTVMINTLPEGHVKQFCLKLQQQGALRLKISENINSKTNVVGKLFKYNNVPDMYVRLLRETFNVDGGLWQYFLRLKKKVNIFTTDTYGRSKTKVSCFAEIFHNSIPYLCKINAFVKWSACEFNCPPNCEDCQKLFICFVTLYNRIPWEIHEANLQVFVPYLNKVTPSNEVRVFSVTSIRSPCMYMSIDKAEYLALPINNLEVE